MSVTRAIVESLQVEGDRVCAWCKKILGVEPAFQGTTHGLCPDCAEKLVAGWTFDQKTGKWIPPKTESAATAAAVEGETRMSDRVKKKLEETASLQRGRRQRTTAYDTLGLSTRGTKDRFVEAQVVEQPQIGGPEQDVIVQPDAPPDAPGMIPQGDEMPPDDAMEQPVEEPETDVDEEKKRALFNTLSELIDLGQISRNEQEIRKHVEEHEDEIGELIDVLDDVIDMLIGEGSILREPKTFDVGDQEQPATNMNAFDEMKPGVGQQVSQGGTTTTVIASDQTPSKGGALHESIVDAIVDGVDPKEALARVGIELHEDTVELQFNSPEDLEQALKVIDNVSVASTNVMKAGPTVMNIVKDERNQAEVEQQLAAIRDAGIEFQEPVAAEGQMSTPATLVAGPNVGQGLSTVQGEGYQSWTRPGMQTRAAMGESQITDQDLRDLGLMEEANVTRTGMAVEVAFGGKGQAGAAKGALLQYKGIDSVQETGNETLVVFTTDYDPEEARNRVTTILNNARVPMEHTVRRYKKVILESNPGGQSAVGSPVPGISRAYNGPDEMPTPIPTAGGQSGADLEQADDEKVQRCKCGGTYVNDVCQSCKRRRSMQDVKTEQVGDVDPEGKIKYMKPFYAPDDEGDEELGEPLDQPIGDDDVDLPTDDEAPVDVAGGVLFRMDVPEDPNEYDRLSAALNQAKEAGVIASWTEIGGPEDDFQVDDLPVDDVDVDVDVDMGEVGPIGGPPVEPPGGVGGGAPRRHVGEQAGIPDVMGPPDPDIIPDSAPVADVEPGGASVDELPPEEPALDDEPYIAVEFAAETEPEERERFPDWITDETGDPETGEGGVIVAGWRADDGGEGIPSETPEEIPGMSPEITPDLSGDSEDLNLIPTADVAADEVPVPEERILGEDAQHLRNIYSAVKEAKRRGDETNRKRFAESLVSCGHARKITRAVMARLLKEDEANLEQVYWDPEDNRILKKQVDVLTTGATKGIGGELDTAAAAQPQGPQLPPELAQMYKEYQAAKTTGDDATAQSLEGKLRFELDIAGIDPKTVFTECDDETKDDSDD